MDKTTLVTCIELVELDQRILQINQEHDQNVLQLDQQVLLRQTLVVSFEQVRQRAHDAKKAVDSIELELKVVAGLIRKTEDKLTAGHNQKEINALSAELTDLRSKKSVLEEQGLELILQYEMATKSLEVAQVHQPEQEKKVHDNLNDLEKRQSHLQILKSSYLQKRDELAHQVPQEFLSQYEVMRQRVTNPVVPVLNGSCSGCFQGLSKPDLIKTEQGQLISCHGCYRLLYMYKAVQDSKHDEQYVG